MTNTKILELINDGKIEELKALIQDEIYKGSLKGNGDAAKRYAAMKRYFKYEKNNSNNCLKMPCKDIEVLGEKYNCFTDGYTVACTLESIGEMESIDKTKNEYYRIEQFFDFSGDTEVLDLNKVLADAKSKGYRYKKSETGNRKGSCYFFKYRGGYYKIGLLDKAYSIIDDGDAATVYYINGKAPLVIQTSIGICLVLPIYIESVNKFINGKNMIIEVPSKYDTDSDTDRKESELKIG